MPVLEHHAAVACLCPAPRMRLAHVYHAPPAGETRFEWPSGETYRRELHECSACGHVRSECGVDLEPLYAAAYVDATYGESGMLRQFERIIALPPERSDNLGRVRRVRDAAAAARVSHGDRSILDIGSGLCVFLQVMRQHGWRCTAVDPDPRAVEHARVVVGVEAVCADLRRPHALGWHDVVTLNKVLEHVADPVALLRHAAACLRPRGIMYLEVPDGEAALAAGPHREELFIEHVHAFSITSVSLLCRTAGLRALTLQRLVEPSGKLTLWCTAQRDPGSAAVEADCEQRWSA
jgi:SAM-dependent methyltransferase